MVDRRVALGVKSARETVFKHIVASICYRAEGCLLPPGGATLRVRPTHLVAFRRLIQFTALSEA